MCEIVVNDLFDEIINENNRLCNQLVFAMKCLDVLQTFETFIRKVMTFKTIIINEQQLSSQDIQTLDQLDNQLQKVLKQFQEIKIAAIRDKSLKCLVCNHKCLKVSDLVRHLKTRHQIRPIGCKLNGCYELFVTKDQLKQHVFQRHCLTTEDLMNELFETKTEENRRLVSEIKSATRLLQFFETSADFIVKVVDLKTILRQTNCLSAKEAKEVNKLDIKLKDVLKELTDNKRFTIKTLNKDIDDIEDHKILQKKKLSRSHKHIKQQNEDKDGEDLKAKYKCQHKSCGKVFSKLSYLNKHVLYIHVNRNLKCDYNGCDLIFKNPTLLRRHKQRQHNDGVDVDNTCDNNKSFACKICDKVFNKQNLLSLHVRRQHVNRNLKCEHIGCDLIFKNRETLIHHQKKHNGIKYNCPEQGCDKVYNTKHGLRYHCNINHKLSTTGNSKPYRCTLTDTCVKSFTCQQLLNRHISNMHSGQTFSCDYLGCDKTFRSEKLLKIHKNKHKDIESGQQFPCLAPGCGKVCKTQYSLKCHLYTNHTDKVYRCDWSDCNFTASTSNLLYKHKLTHKTQVLQYKCPEPGCGRVFQQLFRLTFHRKHHTTVYRCSWPECTYIGKSYQCLYFHRTQVHQKKIYRCVWPGCEWQSIHPSAYYIHRRQHVANSCDDKIVKTYRCDWPGCDKVMTNRISLYQHKLIHTGKQYPCDWPGCKYVTIRKTQLKLHCQTHLPKDKRETKYQCSWPQCDKILSTNKTLREHMRIHTGKPFECHFDGCYHRTVSRSALNQHIKLRHNL
ncbi:zinc finger protein 845-like [Oppia nitens]|uniref:zinc finger protein 845-like n=1 Tax=Oppia nitens TaxID=1686743 RepID=UPI0023DC6253|nr:zinc finger protein 845-like [Oppia nitens]